MIFQVKKLKDGAVLPIRGTDLAGGYDLVACIDKPMSIRAGDKATLIPTGLAIFSNHGNVVGLILPRSGLGHKKGLVLGNTAGVVDGDYQAEWFVSAWNRGQEDEVIINPGDRIAQVLFVPVIHPAFMEVAEFDIETGRGLGGFGSTGVARPAVLSESYGDVLPKTFEAAARAEGIDPGIILGSSWGSLGEPVA